MESELEAFDAAHRARRGARFLIGVDEAGRGPLAGPVVAAAVLLPERPLPELAGVRDSKQLSPARREKLFPVIRASAEAVGVGWAHPEEIDRDNILRASLRAMYRALGRLQCAHGELNGVYRETKRVHTPEGWLILLDGSQRMPVGRLKQEPVVAGDRKSLCIAAASIVAKVVRDRWMRVLDVRHPGYGLSRHKGYGTAEHYAALESLGPLRGLHRASFLKNRESLRRERSDYLAPR